MWLLFLKWFKVFSVWAHEHHCYPKSSVENRLPVAIRAFYLWCDKESGNKLALLASEYWWRHSFSSHGCGSSPVAFFFFFLLCCCCSNTSQSCWKQSFLLLSSRCDANQVDVSIMILACSACSLFRNKHQRNLCSKEFFWLPRINQNPRLIS